MQLHGHETTLFAFIRDLQARAFLLARKKSSLMSGISSNGNHWPDSRSRSSAEIWKCWLNAG